MEKITHMSDTSAGRKYNANIAALLIYSGHVLRIPIINWLFLSQGTHK
jgi:hypothetical protein